MIITTTETVPNREILEIVGFVKGCAYFTAKSDHGYFASIKTLMGGELEEYTRVQDNTRNESLLRLQKEAEKLGADAVVAVRLSSTVVFEHVSELLAYGTAVKLKPT